MAKKNPRDELAGIVSEARLFGLDFLDDFLDLLFDGLFDLFDGLVDGVLDILDGLVDSVLDLFDDRGSGGGFFGALQESGPHKAQEQEQHDDDGSNDANLFLVHDDSSSVFFTRIAIVCFRKFSREAYFASARQA